MAPNPNEPAQLSQHTPPSALSPFPQEILERILSFAAPGARATSLRVNSAFYHAGVRSAYAFVKILPDTPRPFASPRADQLAAHVRTLELGVHPLSECQAGAGKAAPFPPSMPNLRTLRLNLRCDGETDPLHSDLSADTPAPCGMLAASSRKIVIHGINVKIRSFQVLPSLRSTLPSHRLSEVRELVYVFDPDIDVEQRGHRRLLPDWREAPFSGPLRFTIVFWTKIRGELWVPVDTYRSQTNGSDDDGEQRITAARIDIHLVWSLFWVLFCHPAPETGEPLITVVNAGAIPLHNTLKAIVTTLSPDELRDEFTVDQRAPKIEKYIRAHFERLCEPYAIPDRWTHPIKRELALKSVKESMRFISMDEYLAEPGALDAFDEDALAGWQ
ncbi:uncharacterized protein LOC62_05G007303 [Vanrija pseudolonga]|uniref:F-box domain-containing protein n=1 Tax=Vanrija pseudolonga TaxID=143232 RepID=A0AAF0YBP1_9TREE|nr:hypothetical protein LOC62_05G007303 [Vanrija pseudolonga]